MTSDLHALSVAEASRLIGSQALSPVEYVRALLDRIAGIGPQIDAFITVTGDAALDQARRAEREIMAGRRLGPLHGIPYALKDIIDTAGVLTSAHSHVARSRVPGVDATVNDRLKRAGAILLGKLATHEFAHGGIGLDLPWPPARNPWNTAHITGGSSSGAGAAVAAGLVPAALGTDTGGSIRIPAGLCGVAGFKPTYGLVSRHGIIPNSHSFDHCGPLAWTVEDCAMLLSAISGHDWRDPTSLRIPAFRADTLAEGIRGARIGVLRGFWEGPGSCSPALRDAMEEALLVLADLGATLADVRIRPVQDYADVKITIAETEIFSTHQHGFQHRLGEYGVDFRNRTLGACLFGAADYFQAQRQRRQMLHEFESLYDECDLLVTVGNGPAPRLDVQAGQPYSDKWKHGNVYNPFSVSGGPALALCIGFSEAGLPLSMQIGGRPGDDAAVLRAGHAYEKATSWRGRRPLLQPGAAKPPIAPVARQREPVDDDPVVRAHALARLAHAGITPDGDDLERLIAAAPHVLAMARRIRREMPWDLGPAHRTTLLSRSATSSPEEGSATFGRPCGGAHTFGH